MGLITNLVQMKANRDLQAKETAIEGFKSVLTNKNATPEMRQWAQQGVLDLTTNAIVGDGKGGKKQQAGVKQVLGSILGGLTGGLSMMNPMASGPSKGAKQQIARAQAGRPQRMELTEDEKEALAKRQALAQAQVEAEIKARADKETRVQQTTDYHSAFDRLVKAGHTPLEAADLAEEEVYKAKPLPRPSPLKWVPGVTKGSEPKIQNWAATSGMEIDPNKAYRVQEDASGSVVSVMEAAAAPTQQRLTGIIQGYYYEGLGKGYNDADARIYAGRRLTENQDIHLGRTEQQAAMDEALSGIPLGGGLKRGKEAERGLTPTTPPAAAQPGAPAKPGAPGAPGAQARPPFTGIAPAKPAARPAAAAQQQSDRFINMFMDSLYGNLPGGTGGAAQIGINKGRDALRKATGLDPVTFATMEAQSKESLKTFNQIRLRRGAVDQINNIIGQFGDEAVKRAKDALQTGSPFLNKHIRDIELAAVGDPDLRRFLVAYNGFERQYANLTAGGTFSRAQLPVGTGERVDKVLSPNSTLREVIEAVDQVKIEGQREQQGLKDAEKDTIQEAVDSIRGGRGGATTPTRTGAPGAPAPAPGGSKLSPAAKRYLDRVMGR